MRSPFHQSLVNNAAVTGKPTGTVQPGMSGMISLASLQIAGPPGSGSPGSSFLRLRVCRLQRTLPW
jgi:hypothetical protein